MTTAQERKVGDFFTSFASDWDTLYGHKRNFAWRLFDSTFRRDVYERYAFTLRTMGTDLTGLTVLDVGCGNGIYSIEAAKRGAKKVVGVDVAPGMIDLASRQARELGYSERCTFQVGQVPDVVPSLAAQGPFDYVILMGVLDYIADAGPFLKALKPVVGRSLIASVPGRRPLRYWLRRTRYRLLGRPDVFHYTRQDVDRIFAEGGFRINQLTYWSHSGGCFMVVAS
jgi:2-polyprenyl-3-methyl-5-hydroxy-6-metoxy-1,4-benzoquinol methylase